MFITCDANPWYHLDLLSDLSSHLLLHLAILIHTYSTFHLLSCCHLRPHPNRPPLRWCHYRAPNSTSIACPAPILTSPGFPRSTPLSFQECNLLRFSRLFWHLYPPDRPNPPPHHHHQRHFLLTSFIMSPTLLSSLDLVPPLPQSSPIYLSLPSHYDPCFSRVDRCFPAWLRRPS